MLGCDERCYDAKRDARMRSAMLRQVIFSAHAQSPLFLANAKSRFGDSRMRSAILGCDARMRFRFRILESPNRRFAISHSQGIVDFAHAHLR